jgi:hypothetical protein
METFNTVVWETEKCNKFSSSFVKVTNEMKVKTRGGTEFYLEVEMLRMLFWRLRL